MKNKQVKMEFYPLPRNCSSKKKRPLPYKLTKIYSREFGKLKYNIHELTHAVL